MGLTINQQTSRNVMVKGRYHRRSKYERRISVCTQYSHACIQVNITNTASPNSSNYL